MAPKDQPTDENNGPAIPEESGTPQVPAGDSEVGAKAKADAEAKAQAKAEEKAKADAEAAAKKPKSVRVIVEDGMTLGPLLLKKGDVTKDKRYVALLDVKGQKKVEAVK